MRSILLNIRLNTRSDNFHWHDVDWHKVVNNVRKLQCRIAKAVKLQKPKKVIKGLMRLLNKSLSARLLAVKKVVSNKGKNTTGIDGVKLNTPEKKIAAVKWLKQNNNQTYKAKALKRVFIPKKQKNKKRQKISLQNLLRRMNVSKDWRPLGIPTLHDRCLQALHKLSLEPVSETTADLNSYAYRPVRSVKDAIQQVFAVIGYKNSAHCILEGDITGCFDNISHKWTLDNIPLNRHILKEWLKSGYVYENHLFKSESGTPQGGIISPLIANMVLDGLEENSSTVDLLETLTPILRGWANHNNSQVSKNIFEDIDNYIWHKSVNYMQYRHNRRRYKYFYKKYFTKSNKHNVDVLHATKKQKEPKQKSILLKMFRLGEVKITRHIKVRSLANVFDKNDELYFEKRELDKWKKSSIFANKKKQLRLKQLSKCSHCGHLIYLNETVEIHHKIYKAKGGSDKLDNLELLHENCHRQLHYIQNVGITCD